MFPIRHNLAWNLTWNLTSLVLVWIVAACDKQAPVLVDEDPPVESVAESTYNRIEVNPKEIRGIAGERVELYATGFGSYGEEADISLQGTWSSANPELLGFIEEDPAEDTQIANETPVGNEGNEATAALKLQESPEAASEATAPKKPLVLMLQGGETEIIFSFQGQEIKIPVVIEKRTVKNLIPSSDSITLTLAQRNGNPIPTNFKMDITAYFSNSAIENVTDKVNWSTSSEQENVIRKSDAEDEVGTFIAESPGTAWIRTSYGGKGTLTEVIVELEEKKPSHLTTVPPTLFIPAGTPAKFEIIQHFTDQSSETVAQVDSMESLNPEFVTLGEPSTTEASSIVLEQENTDEDPKEIALSQTLFQAIAGNNPGNGLIKITLGEISTDLAVRVIDPIPSSLQVVPVSDGNIPLLAEKQFLAELTLTDGSIIDVTNQAIWVTESPSIAKFSSEPEKTGALLGRKKGSTKISLEYAEIVTSYPIEVLEAAPKSLSMSTTEFGILAKGYTRQYFVRMTKTDDTESDANSDVTWSIEPAAENGGNATVSEQGLVQATEPGVVYVITTIDSVTQRMRLEIGQAVINRLEIESPSLLINLADGPTYQLKANLIYSDESVVEVTTDAGTNWAYQISDTFAPVGFIDNATKKGEVTLNGLNGNFLAMVYYGDYSAQLVLGVTGVLP